MVAYSWKSISGQRNDHRREPVIAQNDPSAAEAHLEGRRRKSELLLLVQPSLFGPKYIPLAVAFYFSF